MSLTASVLEVGWSTMTAPSVSRIPSRPRAQRFVLATPLLYRVLNGRAWERGITINFSESGMLLEAAHPIPLGTRLEVSLQLAEQVGSVQAGDVRCVGEVVRHGLPTPSIPDPIGVEFVAERLTESSEHGIAA